MGNTILGANTLSGGYEVANSCRFNGGDSQKFNIDHSGAGNRDLWTLSMWVKRSNLGAEEPLFNSRPNSNFETFCGFAADNTLVFKQKNDGSTTGQYVTNRVFEDTASWYHFVFVYDKDNSTAGNRGRIYVNGVEETSFSTESNFSDSSTWNSTNTNNIGNSQTAYFDGYMCEVVFIDGQALAPTSFGEYDEDSEDVWKPISDVSDLTPGTNGFWLDFKDGSNMGNNAFGSGSADWTETNIDATNQSTDTCTNNFATFNFLNSSRQSGGVVAYTEGALKIVTSYTNSNYLRYPQAYSTLGVTSGKWYAEFKPLAMGSAAIGITNTGEYPSDGTTNPYAGAPASGAVYTNGGEYRANDGSTGGQGTYTTNDIIGVALDLDNLKIYWHKNGTYINSGDPTSGATGTGARAVVDPITPGGFYVFTAGADNTSVATIEANFGSSHFAISSGNSDGNGYGNFEYAVPSGYYSLNTKNIAQYG